MLLGLSHITNEKYKPKQSAILSQMAVRNKSQYSLQHYDWKCVDDLRNEIRRINSKHTITGIAIMDELVPVPKVYRTPNYLDTGIADNIYGNISKQWVDKDNNGMFDINEMPEEYHQDCWVCRFVPYSSSYSGVGWFKWWYSMLLSIQGVGSSRSYSSTLDHWLTKLTKNTTSPLSSFIATSDWSGVDEERKEGFRLNLKTLREQKVFDKMFNYGKDPYFLEYTSPSKGDAMRKLWQGTGVGTAWHAAHSAAAAMGDMRYDDAYINMKEGRGPTLLLTYACSVGEWNTSENHNILANIFNSKEDNNIKCIIGSGLMQWGAGFGVQMDEKGSWGAGDSSGIVDAVYDADNFFTLMKKYEGQPIGLAHKDWLNLAYKHYIAKNIKYPDEKKDWKEVIINVLAMNIIGDGSLIL